MFFRCFDVLAQMFRMCSLWHQWQQIFKSFCVSILLSIRYDSPRHLAIHTIHHSSHTIHHSSALREEGLKPILQLGLTGAHFSSVPVPWAGPCEIKNISPCIFGTGFLWELLSSYDNKDVGTFWKCVIGCYRPFYLRKYTGLWSAISMMKIWIHVCLNCVCTSEWICCVTITHNWSPLIIAKAKSSVNLPASQKRWKILAVWVEAVVWVQ